MNEFEKKGFATFIDNGEGWERLPNAKFMMRDENGNETEMTPREVINQLYQDNKALEHYISNLQSKIDKTYDYLDKFIPNEYGVLLTERQWQYVKDVLKENK